MSTKQEENDVYIIPPNFIETGTLFGGTIKIRNAIEAFILTVLIGVPVFKLPFTLTTTIIIACLTVLPAALFAIIGIDGDSLSSFIIHFFRFLKNRRIIGAQETDSEQNAKTTERKQKKAKKHKNRSEDFAEEFGKRDKPGKKYRTETEIDPLNPVVSYLPIRRIDHGIIYTTDHQYVKIIEVLPINFLLRSAREQRNIIYSFVSYLKICPVKLQFKVLTKRADINRHLETIQEVFYHLLNRRTSSYVPFSTHMHEVIAQYLNSGRQSDMKPIVPMEYFAPQSIDYTHGNYVVMDGIYHTYLLIPSGGYRTQVYAGWISLLVNAGEGIDVDIFFEKQAKDRIQQKLGQQLRINRSKLKDASDTNTDFDDLDSAIRSGYFLKEGLASNEDFYYMNILITITADSLEELEWRTNEMQKLLLSQDMEAVSCHFREEQALLSALPLNALDKGLFRRSKRNILTTGVASCYPFTSFEMCDDNGILLGVNKHNNSLVIVDIFNSKVYKNANMAILGTSGAGKTFTMQLMALRMRRKNIQVFIIAPLKGHEFHRACSNIGGEFIQISPASKNCINIMEIRKVDHSTKNLIDGPQSDHSELAAKIQRLHIFFSLLIPDMNHEEKQLLDEALIQTYNRKGITHNNESLISPDNPDRYREMPVLEDVFNILKENPDTKRLANIMNRLVHGSASTFNQQTDVNLENKYTVLDISELTGDLLTVGMFVVLDYVWDKAKEDRTVEKAIFIDEIWHLIGAASNRLAAEFVLEIFKIIRGYGGSAICATQDLNDFFSLDDGKYGKGIINNSKTKIILNLEDEEAMRVQSILHLSEAETMAITHFERGNGLLSTNNNNVTLEFKASELEKELITTDRQELKNLLEKEKLRQIQNAANT